MEGNSSEINDEVGFKNEGQGHNQRFGYSEFQVRALTERTKSVVEQVSLTDDQREGLLSYFSPQLSHLESLNQNLDPNERQRVESFRKNLTIRKLLHKAFPDYNLEKSVREQMALEGMRELQKDIIDGRVDIVKRILIEDYLAACSYMWDMRRGVSQERDKAIGDMAHAVNTIRILGAEPPTDDEAARIIMKRNPYKETAYDRFDKGPSPAFGDNGLYDDIIRDTMRDAGPATFAGIHFSDYVKSYNEKHAQSDSNS